MGLNDIVVYVDSAEATKARVGFAVALAKEHGAHLIGIAFAPTALLPLYGADVGFADMTEVMESVKTRRQGAASLRGLRQGGRRERRGKADAGHERGVSARLRARRGTRRPRHSRPASRRRSTDRPVCAGRTLPVRFGSPGHHRAGVAGEACAQRYGRCGVGRQRGSGARDQRRDDIPKPAARVVLVVGVRRKDEEERPLKSTTWWRI